MWSEIRDHLRHNSSKIIVDEAHTRDDRDGRYKRAMEELGRVLAKGVTLGYLDFRQLAQYPDFDVCEIVFWHLEEFDSCGRYMVLRCFYSSSRRSMTTMDYRTFKQGEICCYYDGEDPNPGKSLTTKEEAIECMQRSGGYHVV